MLEKTLPCRKCVFCGQMKPKNKLFRIVKCQENIFYDSTYKANGRGAYVCKDNICIDGALKKKSFNRALKCFVDTELIQVLHGELNGNR